MSELELLENELQSARDFHGEDNVALIPLLDKVAFALHSQGNYSHAEQLYFQSLQLRERHQPEDFDGLVRALHGLGLLMRVQNKFPESEPYYLRALDIVCTARGATHPETATRQNYLAGLYFASGRYAEAQRLVESSLGIYKVAFGSDHYLVALASLALVFISNRLGDADGTRQHFRRADSLINQKMRGAVIESLNDVAGGLLILARDKFKQGKLDEAETLFRYSMLLETNDIWPDHPLVAENVQLLGDLYKAQGMRGEAEFLYKKAIEIRRRVFGAEHLDVAVSLNSLGTLLYDSKRHDEADAVLREAVEIRSKAGFPPVLANTLRAYAANLRKLGRLEDADRCESKAAKIWEKYNPALRQD